jgi:hypothetical protein
MSDGRPTVGFRADEELVEQFMLAYRKAQAEGLAPADGDRSDAFRQLMRAFVNNPEIIKYGASDSEFEASGDS